MPDIDLDFPRDIRERLILAVHERYGHEHAALVARLRHLPRARARSASSARCSACRPPTSTRLATRLRRLAAPASVGAEMRAAATACAERAHDRRFRALAAPGRRDRRAAAPPLPALGRDGRLRPAAARRLVPLVPAAMEGRQICQWDKDSCGDAGFLKIDLLGLGMLSAVEECVDLVGRTRGEALDLSRIPLDDPGVYAEIQDADTVGVFQIESRAQMQMLLRTRPQRPRRPDRRGRAGPARADPGRRRPPLHRSGARRGARDPDYQIPYDHPLLAEALRDTLGVIVFQDQVLEVAMALAGLLARAGRGAAAGHEPPALARGAARALARRSATARPSAGRARGRRRALVFDKILGLLRVRLPEVARRRLRRCWPTRAPGCAAYYPAEFLCSLLNAQPMGFYPPASLIRDGHAPRRRGARRSTSTRSAVACSVELRAGRRRSGSAWAT